MAAESTLFSVMALEENNHGYDLVDSFWGVCLCYLFLLHGRINSRPNLSQLNGVTVTLRQISKCEWNLGGIFILSSACERGEEAVVGGTPIPPSHPNLVLVASTLFYDGVGSGWLLMYRNNRINHHYRDQLQCRCLVCKRHGSQCRRRLTSAGELPIEGQKRLLNVSGAWATRGSGLRVQTVGSCLFAPPCDAPGTAAAGYCR